MAVKPPPYFAGMLDVGRDPDWDRIARIVDLVRANGVHMVTSPAVVDSAGQMRLPFFAKTADPFPLPGLDGVDPRATIEALCPYRLDAYTKVDPRTAGNLALRAMVKLSTDNVREQPTKPGDLKPRRPPAPNPDDAFEGLVGLGRQRDALRKIATLVAKHGRDSVECLHMAFVGAPGTGKTELAQRLLAHFDAVGVTDGSGTFVKASAADLVGQYMGHTPARTRAVVERAYGGLLFIDEAYALLDSSSYGQEAIDTLVEMLEADRDRLVCVIAGYPDEVEELFRRNPGLRDRFGLRIRFDDYTASELARIFQIFADGHGFSVSPSAQRVLADCLGRMVGARDFANARSVRRLFDRTIMETACRTDEKRIAAEDIRAAFDQPDLGGAAQACRIGFGR